MAYEKGDRKDGDRPRGRRGPRSGDGKSQNRGGDRPFKSSDKRGFKPRRKDDGDSKPRRTGDRKDFKRSGGRDRKDSRSSRGGERGRPRRDSKPFNERKGESRFERKPEEEVRQDEPRKLLLPQDASRLLYRGIDCQVNGNDNLAMIMFLHGSVMMSEGCENNADRILKEKGKANFATIRTEIGPNCSEDALTEFDYLCIKRNKDYDRTFFDNEYAKGSTHAIYRRICLEEVEGDDPIIDVFVSRYPDDDKKVVKGLEILKRKKDSEIAEKHLIRIDESVKLKQSVYVMFTRAMNGDARAVQELKENSKKVPEAAFFSEYLAAKAEGTNVEWLRAKYPQYRDLIVSRQGEFKIQDTPFGMFLKAKNLEMKKEESMSVMMNAARAGSQEAIDELSAKMFRNDVRKCLAGIYLKDNDLDNLMIVYQAGLDDMYYLDQYCGADRDRILEVGKNLGKQSVGKEIDWLKDHYDKDMEFCKDALIKRSSDEFYHSKRMIYALHDVGADMEAAKLYFEMEGDPEAPSVKWLKKVCGEEDVKEYVRDHYVSKGQEDVFESIFAEDGYERRPKRQSAGGRRGSFGKPRRRER
ncbi:hypothetical protein PED39_07460 [Methanomassiliicoccales archaeon LGM-RCC1]|nr:hypothetical protein PED39_07460 [Methanomassiliicoccales archaeon LGM-RCC1]